MKLALIHYRYGPGGGMDAYYADLVRGFAARGDSVDLWVYEKSEGFAVPPNARVRQVNLRPAFRALRKIAFHHQIVRELNPADYDLVLGTMRTLKQDININGGTHLGFIGNVHGKLRYTDYLPVYFERRTFRKSRAIIAHSQMVAAEIEAKYQIPREKIHLLYPPSDDGRFNPAVRNRRNEAIARYGIDPSKFTVFFPSTNHEIKGLRPLLDAFATLPQDRFELLIAGAALDSSAAVAPNIRYLGYVSKIEELYAASDLTILPSYYDGFGLVITESLACGTPVIVSKAAGASELVEPKYGIVLADEEPATIARAILEARERSFSIEPDFLKMHGLTPAQHVDALCKIAAPYSR